MNPFVFELPKFCVASMSINVNLHPPLLFHLYVRGDPPMNPFVFERPKFCVAFMSINVCM